MEKRKWERSIQQYLSKCRKNIIVLNNYFLIELEVDEKEYEWLIFPTYFRTNHDILLLETSIFAKNNLVHYYFIYSGLGFMHAVIAIDNIMIVYRFYSYEG